MTLGFSGIGRAGFPKTKWPPPFPPLCTLSEHSQNFEYHTDCLVSQFYQTPLKKLLPSSESERNISLGRDSRMTESRARRNRPTHTGLVYVYGFMDVRTTENRARRSTTQHEHDNTVDSFKNFLLLCLQVCMYRFPVYVLCV